jgi:hypothetical protein
MQKANGIRLSLSKSKSKKRILQAKNISFKPDYYLASKYNSLSPTADRNYNSEAGPTHQHSDGNDSTN